MTYVTDYELDIVLVVNLKEQINFEVYNTRTKLTLYKKDIYYSSRNKSDMVGSVIKISDGENQTCVSNYTEHF